MDSESLIVEFQVVGAYVKVSAVDPVTLEEVSIVGDPRRGEAALSALAVRKLRYVQQRRRNQGAAAGGTSFSV